MNTLNRPIQGQFDLAQHWVSKLFFVVVFFNLCVRNFRAFSVLISLGCNFLISHTRRNTILSPIIPLSPLKIRYKVYKSLSLSLSVSLSLSLQRSDKSRIKGTHQIDRLCSLICGFVARVQPN